MPGVLRWYKKRFEIALKPNLYIDMRTIIPERLSLMFMHNS